MNSPIPHSILKRRLLNYLESDLQFGDLSTGLIPKYATGKANIIAKSAGIVAGVMESSIIFEELGLEFTAHQEDGSLIKVGDILFNISGSIQNILMGERLVLNFLMKLSSIATSTADYVKSVRAAKLNTIIAATRKTTPGFGWYEKRAAHLGGGDTHRWNLSDMVMFKDTHLKFFGGDVLKLLEEAHAQISFSKKIELEIEDPADISNAIKGGADIIMLDNMNPTQIKDAITSAKKLADYNKKILFEASGNITRKNVVEYAKSGVDIISTSSPIFNPHIQMDFSLKLVN